MANCWLWVLLLIVFIVVRLIVLVLSFFFVCFICCVFGLVLVSCVGVFMPVVLFVVYFVLGAAYCGV